MGFIVSSSSRLWLGDGPGQISGRIPYWTTFGEKSEAFGELQVAIIHWRMATAERIKFVPATDKEKAPGSPISRVLFRAPQGEDEEGTIAHSETIGRKGGEQYVAFDLERAREHRERHGIPLWSTLAHEMGHVVGLYHEHIRPDRDSKIQVLWQNIDGICAYCRHAYESQACCTKCSRMTAPQGVTVGLYDFQSLMHYRQTQRLKNVLKGTKAKAWVPWNPKNDPKGAHIRLSPGDVATVLSRYK